MSDPLFMTGASADEVWPLVRDFHYSRRMPSFVTHCFAWRDEGGLFGNHGEPHAAAIYGIPVNRSWPSDALELKRLVRRESFGLALSEFVCWSLRWLRGNTPCPFVLSYADSGQRHFGGIYQASGFYYVGETRDNKLTGYLVNGEKVHGRQVARLLGTQATEEVARLRPDWTPLREAKKFLYIKPLRRRLKPLLRDFGWQVLPFPRDPSIGRPAPSGVSHEHTVGVAPMGQATGARSKAGLNMPVRLGAVEHPDGQ